MPRKATGSLLWRSTGWYGRYFTNVDGVRTRICEDLGTKNELIARQRLAKLCDLEIRQEGPPPVETFEEAAERVHLTRLRTHACAPNEMCFQRNHVIPAIGRMPVTEVTKRDVSAVLEAVRDAGLAGQTILHVRKGIAAVFRQLLREGVIDVLPLPSVDELPDALPETIDDRPKAVLSDDELLIYLAHTEARPQEVYRGPQRERQMMALLSRCIGGMRTGELHGLTWTRLGCEGRAFEAVEVIRYKTRKKASARGGKAVGRQIYPLGDTVLPLFLRYWHVRATKFAGAEPAPSAFVFPVRRAKRSADTGKGELIDRVGERRRHSTWANPLRRDLKRAFAAALAAGDTSVPAEGSRRWLELFNGTEDRKPLWFHNSRNAAAIGAERFERLAAAARFTGHASGRMLQHYREMAGEVDVVPMLPALLPDADRLEAAVRSWCIADGIDLELVFRAESSAELSGEMTRPEQNDLAARNGSSAESASIAARQGESSAAESRVKSLVLRAPDALPKLAHYQAVLHPEERAP
jgi:integrase